MTVVITYPLVRMVVRCVHNVRASGIGRPQAVAFVAALPGLGVIALTGHGLVTDHIMLLLFFILGFSYRSTAPDMRVSAPPPAEIEAAERREAEARVQALPPRVRVREVAGAGAGAAPSELTDGTRLPMSPRRISASRVSTPS